MSNRRNRRRRHKRHKARARTQPKWKLWSMKRRGLEMADIRLFERGNQPQTQAVMVGSGPDCGRIVTLEPGQRYVTVARCNLPPMLRGALPPEIRTVTYAVVRRREGRLFFAGTVRRYRDLMPTLELV